MVSAQTLRPEQHKKNLRPFRPSALSPQLAPTGQPRSTSLSAQDSAGQSENPAAEIQTPTTQPEKMSRYETRTRNTVVYPLLDGYTVQQGTVSTTDIKQFIAKSHGQSADTAESICRTYIGYRQQKQGHPVEAPDRKGRLKQFALSSQEHNVIT